MAAAVCSRCRSTERRPNGKGCAACERRRQRTKWREKSAAIDNFEVTPLMRGYLTAFDEFILARRDGDWSAENVAAWAKARALVALEDAAERRAR